MGADVDADDQSADHRRQGRGSPAGGLPVFVRSSRMPFMSWRTAASVVGSASPAAVWALPISARHAPSVEALNPRCGSSAGCEFPRDCQWG